MSEPSFDHALALEILHQIHLNAEIIYNTCEDHVAVLADVVTQMIDGLAQ